MVLLLLLLLEPMVGMSMYCFCWADVKRSGEQDQEVVDLSLSRVVLFGDGLRLMNEHEHVGQARWGLINAPCIYHPL